LISFHAFELRSTFAFAANFKDNFAPLVLDQEIGSFLTCS